MRFLIINACLTLFLGMATAKAEVSEMIFYPEADFSEGIVHFSYQGSQVRDYGFVFDKGVDSSRLLYVRPANHIIERLKDGLLKLTFVKTTNYTYLQKLSRPDFVISEDKESVNILLSGGDCMTSSDCVTEENILTVAVPKGYRVKNYKALGHDLKELQNPIWSVKDNAYTLTARNVKGASIVMQLQKIKGGEPSIDPAVKVADAAVLSVQPSVLRNDRLFERGEVKLSVSGKRELDTFVRSAKEKEYKQVIVEGHTDNIPPKRLKSLYATNTVLSQARAQCVAEYLRAEGVNVTEVTGYGEAHPVASNKSEQGRLQNGRIVLIITP